MLISTLSYYTTELYKEFAAYTTEKLHELGLNFGQMYFIIYVGKHPECTPSELTSALKLDWGHSQRSVAKLAEDGFLIKEKKSGRSYRLTLTPLGKQAFDVCHQVLFDWDATKLTGLTNEEQQLLLNLLCKISIQKVYFEKIRRIAAGGCAMIIVGDVPVGKSHFGKSLFDKKGFAFYEKVIGIAHDNDCKVCAQLHQSDSNIKAMLKYVPGMLTKRISMQELRPLLNNEVAPYITNMPHKKVKEITSAFGTAAVLAKKAGFDMIQIHGDRMCGSFSSSIYNHRTDEYGGTAENRARFAVEAVSAVREKLPDMPIDYKLAVRQENPHYGNAGVIEDELKVFVPMLEKAGVTSFHVTLANHSDLENTIPPKNHPYFGEPGCFLKFCDEVKQYTNLPICGVGGLTDPDFVEKQLADGRIQCAAMSRQLLADPDWVNKLKDGHADQIHRCVRCNKKCLGGLMQHQGTHCIYEK